MQQRYNGNGHCLQKAGRDESIYIKRKDTDRGRYLWADKHKRNCETAGQESTARVTGDPAQQNVGAWRTPVGETMPDGNRLPAAWCVRERRMYKRMYHLPGDRLPDDVQQLRRQAMSDAGTAAICMQRMRPKEEMQNRPCILHCAAGR